MEEENPLISMARTGKILRRSVHTFLQHYSYFTSIAALIALPFSVSVLISQALVAPRSFNLLQSIYSRLHSVFDAAGFPPTSEFFALVCLKLSQTMSSSILTFPFAISFLLLAKGSILQYLKANFPKCPRSGDQIRNSPSFGGMLGLYSPLLSTYLWNSFVIFSANATSLSTLFFAFTFLEGTRGGSPRWVVALSTIGAVFYSVVLANAMVVTNLALVASGMEGSGGFSGILRACVLIGRTSTALALLVPVNLGLAAVEALFYFRLVANSSIFYDPEKRQLWAMALEGLLIGLIYSIIIVLDVIISFFFYQTCKDKEESMYLTRFDRDDQEVDEEFYQYYHNENVEKLKGLEQFV